jgi:F0F1-type ATP synthase membrane subunit b/b'
MDPTLKQLGDLLLRAVPTMFFLVFLTLYLKYVFFRPLERILDKRNEETEGARRLAEQAFAAADRKVSDFEKALQAARMDLHREQEAQRKRWLTDQTQAISAARAHAEMRIEETRRELAEETDRATAELAVHARSLAKQIIENMLSRRAA